MVQRRELRSWQALALEAWREAGRRGVIEAATGCGKTVVALTAIDELVLEHAERSRVAIVVPSLQLAEQWWVNLVDSLGIPEHWIARWHSDAPSGPATGHVVLTVINSARVKLPPLMREWRRAGLATLLVVDECHHAASSENRKIFEEPADWTVGLSATIERPDRAEDMVYSGLGDVCFRYELQQALDDGVLSPITSINLYVDLTASEQAKYDDLDSAIGQGLRLLATELVTSGASGPSLDVNEIQRLSRSGNTRATRLLSLIRERSELVRSASDRERCVKALADWIAGTDHTVLVFHESIAQAERSHHMFAHVGLTAALEHSELPNTERKRSALAFRDGNARILAVVKAFDEGVDVPEASCALVVAGSGTKRQRLQRFGRILRHRDGKHALAISILVRGTPEELVVGLRDEELLGAERVRHHRWNPDTSIHDVVAAEASTYRPTQRLRLTTVDALVGQEMQLIDAQGQMITPFESTDGAKDYSPTAVAEAIGRSESWVRNNLGRTRFEHRPGDDLRISRAEARRLFHVCSTENLAKQRAAAPKTFKSPTPRTGKRVVLDRPMILQAARRLGTADAKKLAGDLGVDVDEVSRFLTKDVMLRHQIDKALKQTA